MNTAGALQRPSIPVSEWLPLHHSANYLITLKTIRRC